MPIVAVKLVVDDEAGRFEVRRASTRLAGTGCHTEIGVVRDPLDERKP
jgi:hypothetical protein